MEGLRLLVAEDDVLTAIDLERMLAGFGVEVVGPVPDVAGALDLARRAPLDGAVLDMALRGGGAYPVIEVLRERGVPVILATGYPAEALQVSARTLPRLAKPYSDRKLARLLLATFGRRAEAQPDRTAVEEARLVAGG